MDNAYQAQCKYYREWYDREMNNIDLSYTAGFFDGEGCISILKRKKGNYNVNHFLRLSIGQKDGKTLDWMKNNFGGNVYLIKRDGSFSWALSDNQAYKFIKLINPFLKYKKPQADLAIKFQEERMMVKRNRTLGLSTEELEKREFMFNEMKLLKKTIIKSQYVGTTTKRANLQKQDVIV